MKPEVTIIHVIAGQYFNGTRLSRMIRGLALLVIFIFAFHNASQTVSATGSIYTDSKLGTLLAEVDDRDEIGLIQISERRNSGQSTAGHSMDPGQRPDSGEDLYEQGLSEKDQGNYETAIHKWKEYVDVVDSPDFRVSQEFIRLVTEEQLREYYEEASRIYYWGLSGESITEKEKTALHQELTYMESLLGQREARFLRQMVEDGDVEVLNKISQFWRERDLTVADQYNERLIEHWERINYALENFDDGGRQEFDDRGGIYIRYGEPNRTRTGIFQYNPGFVNALLASRLDDGMHGADAESASNTTHYLNTLYMVRSYHEYPRYEVWVYEGLSDRNDNVIYLFGNTGGGSRMSLKKSVDDFVPSAAYSMSARNRPYSIGIINEQSGGNMQGGRSQDDDGQRTDIDFSDVNTGNGSVQEVIPPALIMQIMYYRQLASTDEFFGRTYDQMLNRYSSLIDRIPSSLPRQFQQTNSHRMLERQTRAPGDISSHLDSVFDIPLEVYTYRFLDEELQPYLRVYIESDVEQAVRYSELRKRNDTRNIRTFNYELIRSIRPVNDGQSSETVHTDSTVLYDYLERSGLREKEFMWIPHTPAPDAISVYAELHDRTEYAGGSISETSAFRSHLKAIGSTESEVTEPIDAGRFAISDLIFGFSDSNEQGEFHRVEIAHDRVIPENSNITFYQEVYNIPIDSTGIHRFDMTYRIKPERRFSWFGLRSETERSVTIENVHDEPHFEQELEIVTYDLRSRDYTLELIYSSPEGEELYRREIRFTID